MWLPLFLCALRIGMLDLLREYVREHLMGKIVANQDKIKLVILHNPKDEFPMRTITRSPKHEGMWQMQTWDADENPNWDDQYDDIRDALIDLRSEGFRVVKVQ